MNKQEMIRVLQEDPTLQNASVAPALMLDAVLNAIKYGVRTQGRVRLRHFGTFCMKQRTGRVISHPKNGSKMWIGPRRHLVFKPSSSLVE